MCRPPSGICSPPRQKGVKAAADLSTLAHSGRVGGGRGTVVIIRMQGEPAMAEALMILQQPEVHCVFSQRSCPWIMGPWQWRAAQAPVGAVDSDLCSHTRFLVAAAAVLAFMPVSVV